MSFDDNKSCFSLLSLKLRWVSSSICKIQLENQVVFARLSEHEDLLTLGTLCKVNTWVHLGL